MFANPGVASFSVALLMQSTPLFFLAIRAMGMIPNGESMFNNPSILSIRGGILSFIAMADTSKIPYPLIRNEGDYLLFYFLFLMLAKGGCYMYMYMYTGKVE